MSGGVFRSEQILEISTTLLSNLKILNSLKSNLIQGFINKSPCYQKLMFHIAFVLIETFLLRHLIKLEQEASDKQWADKTMVIIGI